MLFYGNKIGTLRFNFTLRDMVFATLTETHYLQSSRKEREKGRHFLVCRWSSLFKKKRVYFSFSLLNVLCLIKEGNHQILTNNKKRCLSSSGWLMAMSVSGMGPVYCCLVDVRCALVSEGLGKQGD